MALNIPYTHMVSNLDDACLCDLHNLSYSNSFYHSIYTNNSFWIQHQSPSENSLEQMPSHLVHFGLWDASHDTLHTKILILSAEIYFVKTENAE